MSALLQKFGVFEYIDISTEHSMFAEVKIFLTSPRLFVLEQYFENDKSSGIISGILKEFKTRTVPHNRAFMVLFREIRGASPNI
jgi:hypothetical protein